MKKNKTTLCFLITLLAGTIYAPVKAQQKQDAKIENVSTAIGPNRVVHDLIQDKKGNIWLAAWQGVFRYDGKSFTNVTGKISSARFAAVLEDSRGNFWFGSAGAGVFYYDGKTFKNFTTKDGLAHNVVTDIYEDNTGSIWIGTEAGASRYDGGSFTNFFMKEAPRLAAGDSMHVSTYEDEIARHNDVNTITDDKTGKLWFGTKGNVSVYDGKNFTVINHDGKPFTNVRSIIRDKKGNIWLGGKDGLWRYDGSTFTNFTQDLIACVYEDKKGNIWTSTESADNKEWVLSRYDAKSLNDKKPVVTEIKSKYKGSKGALYGIAEANDGSIWFCASDGVYRYDGNTVTGFNSKEGQK